MPYIFFGPFFVDMSSNHYRLPKQAVTQRGLDWADFWLPWSFSPDDRRKVGAINFHVFLSKTPNAAIQRDDKSVLEEQISAVQMSS